MATRTGPDQPVKVCFISPLGYGVYRPASGYSFGGTEVQFYLLSRALAEDQAFQVSVLTTVPGEPGSERDGRLTLVRRRGGGRAARGSLRGYASAFLDMRDQLRALDADVYVQGGAGVEVGAYALICRLLRRRFVYVVVSSADLAEPNGLVQGPLAWLYPLGLRVADAIVCQTGEHLAMLRDRYGRRGALIRAGHPLVQPASRDRTTVLWVGRGHPLKQPEMFLALAERLPQERCVLVLMRDEAHDDLLRTVRERAAGLPNVTMHENVPLRDVGKLFEQAKLFVNTSTYEGFPNTFVQAALQGIPVLSWSVDPDGVLTRHGIGVCAGGSFDRLVASAQQVCASKDLCGEIGRRAAAYAREHHDLKRSVAELKALARALAGPRPGEEVR
jgi:glycosyltransferase involved in cell wall biosynthesis